MATKIYQGMGEWAHRFLAVLLLLSLSIEANAQKQSDVRAVEHFLALFEQGKSSHQEALDYISEHWQTAFIPMVLEVVYLQKDPEIVQPLLQLMNKKEGWQQGFEFNSWYKRLWSENQKVLPNYSDFKAGIYKYIDPKFETYFKGRYESDIRLDEIIWGGVKQDGIPPLRNPRMISANEADFLEDDNIVFGIEVNGDVRAYPKRILAWHEMFVDEVGGINVAGVYCTLCGTVILYNTTHNGVNHEIGTSGFLYRSNKLMYDKATQSLWNTLWGTPVIGPLKGKDIELEKMSVVTTTWGEWKRRNPSTTVLSLATGHRRNYDEGEAYKDYFATDKLMFFTPFDDKRLKNKQEILALQFPEYPGKQLAISTKFLSKRPVYEGSLGPVDFVVFTDESGANRVYDRSDISFESFDGQEGITDKEGKAWTLFENRIVREDGLTLQRLPYHRAFWFGWKAAYPNTKLIK
ncbi:MAG: DUF3179 domain-containing protein [Roseivirga sp.]|nr:DUF3179 domain-containing protein [Roseivirga sp.]